MCAVGGDRRRRVRDHRSATAAVTAGVAAAACTAATECSNVGQQYDSNNYSPFATKAHSRWQLQVPTSAGS